MNFKFTWLLFLFLSYSIGSAQKEVVSLNIETTSKLRIKEGYNFLNTKTGDVLVCLIDKKSGVANLLDKDFNVKSTITFDPPKFDNILGYKIKGNTYEILFANNSKKKFSIVSINFDTKRTSQENFKFDFDDEVYLQSVHYNNQLYFFTANRDNDFTIRKLDDNKFPILKKTSIHSKNTDQDLLSVGNFGSMTPKITKIDNRVPNALEQTASQIKLYQKEGFIYLPVENQEDLKTSLYTINLESLTIDQATFEYPKGEVGDFGRYNSFILDDKIFQVGSSKKEMKIAVKSFDDKKLKEFYIEIDKPIDFKNSPIIQDGKTMLPFVNRRELEETSKFLRKISSGNIGVTGYKDDNMYLLTIGGSKELYGGGGMMMVNDGVTMYGGGVPFVQFAFNPTFYSYGTYTTTKSTFFNTHLDADFNYVPKEESENIFDKIKEYNKGIKFDTAEDVFVHEGKVYFSSYNSRNKTLKIIEI